MDHQRSLYPDRRTSADTFPYQWTLWLPLLAGSLALLLYGLTAAPYLTWAHDGADGGELLAAAETLGIAHPPGYPTYLLLLHLWTRLPLGDLAHRGNLFSALCAAGSVALFTRLVAVQFRRERGLLPQVAALLAGLLVATMPTLWAQATISEVYTLNALFFVAVWWALWRWEVASSSEHPRSGLWLVAAGFFLGFGLGNHLSLALLVPGAVVWIARGRGPTWWKPLAGLVVGLGIYAYLPLRARAWPPINWGNPQSWEGFWWLVSGQLYQGFVFGLPAGQILPRLSAWAALMRDQFGWIPLALGWMGLWAEITQARRRRLASLGLTFLLYTVYALGYDTTDSYVYLLPAHFIFAWWVARGLSSLAPTADGGLLEGLKPPIGKGVRIAAVILLCATVGYNMVTQYPTLDLHDDREAWTYGHETLAEMPEDALLLATGDRHLFALWYFRYGVGARSDVAVVTPALWGYAWYRETVHHVHPDLVRGETALPETLAGLVNQVLQRGRPVVATEEVAADPQWQALYDVVQQGSTVYELRPP